MRDIYEGPWSKPGTVARPMVEFHAGLLSDENEMHPVYAMSTTGDKPCDDHARHRAEIVLVAALAQLLEERGVLPSDFTRDTFDDNSGLVSWFIEAVQSAHEREDGEQTR